MGHQISQWLGSPPRIDTLSGEIKQIASREAKRVLNRETEYKVFDTTSAAAVLGTAPLVQNLCAVPQGVTDGTRTGDEMRLHHLSVKISVDNSSTSRAQSYRVVLARFKAVSTAAPYPLAATYFDIPVTNPELDFATHDNRELWTTLWDETFVLSDTGSNRKLSISKEFNLNSRVDFGAGVATGYGQIFMISLSSDNANKVSVSSNVRLTYSNL